jgi:hypothetical protein
MFPLADFQKGLPKEPSNKPSNLRQKATEEQRSKRDLFAERVEGIHAPLDLFELGFSGHLTLGLSQDKRMQSEFAQ